jgi:hypothetical protein
MAWVSAFAPMKIGTLTHEFTLLILELSPMGTIEFYGF